MLEPETAIKIRETFETVINTGSCLEVEESRLFPDGQTKYYLSKKIPLMDFQGNIVGVGGISVDITDRKRKEALEVELQTARSYAEGQRDMAVEIGKFSGGIGHELRTPVATARCSFRRTESTWWRWWVCIGSVRRKNAQDCLSFGAEPTCAHEMARDIWCDISRDEYVH